MTTRSKASETITARDRQVRDIVNETLGLLGSETLDAVAAKANRRAAPQRAIFEQEALNLARDGEGILRWHIGPPPVPGPGHDLLARRRGLRRAPVAASPALSQVLFEKLEASKVGEWLRLVDWQLTRPAWNEKDQLWGMRRLTSSGKLLPLDPADMPKLAGKKVLALIHGTFSNSDSLVKDFGDAPGGPALISAALKAYDCVLCFDHPTLGESPAINAFDLASHLSRGVPASLDMIAHSRGGLVVRWFCEGFRHPDLKCRAILVGSPLAGTSLASPARVKATMDFLANVGDAVGTVAGLGGGPILKVAAILAGLFTRVTGTLATPLADAIVALIPGLAAQAREGGNVELRALRANTGTFDFTGARSPVRYFVVRSNFEPAEKGAWSFLKTFVTRPGASLLDTGADIVFPQENDLVVDTASMAETGELNGQPALIGNIVHDFGTSRTVHHCNYFAQRETIDGIRATFGF